MKPLVCLLSLILLALTARPAAACDPDCEEMERRVGALVFGTPTALLTALITPAVVPPLMASGTNDSPPSYGVGFGYAAVGGAIGVGLSYVIHANKYPAGEWGTGTPLSTSELVVMFTLPAVVLGSAGAMLAYERHRQPKSLQPVQGPPGMSAYIAPTGDGLMVGLGSSF